MKSFLKTYILNYSLLNWINNYSVAVIRGRHLLNVFPKNATAVQSKVVLNWNNTVNLKCINKLA